MYCLLRTAVALAFAVFIVNRSEPHRHSREPLALGACLVAMVAVVSFGAPSATTAPGLLLAGDAIAVISCVWLLTSVLTLGRCFGVLPEARGLVTAGPFRLVRHPVYLGELGACVGLAIASPSPANAAAFAALLIASSCACAWRNKPCAMRSPATRPMRLARRGFCPGSVRTERRRAPSMPACAPKIRRSASPGP